MPTIFVKDSLRAAVEAASGGKNTVLYDDKGYPSYMVVIPKFKLEDIDASLGTGTHPAFIVGGVEKSEIFIGKFQAKVVDGRACSLPGVDPTTSVNYNTSVTYCTSKGQGWHLMTFWEWAAAAWWCMKNGFHPRGNTNYGRSHELTYETGRRVDGGTPGSASGTPRTLTGSGPASWYHDNTPFGISDLVGNVWEWQHGLKLVDGRIYCITDNNYSLDENSWTATDVYIDSTVASDGDHDDDGVYEDVGDPVFSNSITNRTGPVGSDSNLDYTQTSKWASASVTATGTNADMLKRALIIPTLTGAGQLLENAKGYLSARNYGTRLPLRGGSWGAGSDAGLFALNLNDPRSYVHTSIGFRPAYVG